MPTVTVIVPAFNAERYLGEALASIRDQTLKDLEVIVVDDGSTDDTINVAERFANALPLSIVCQSNRGPSAARNTGIRQATGRFCAFLDADDIMDRELLQAQVKRFQSDPELGLVFTDITTFDEGGIINPSHWNFARKRGDRPVIDRLLLDNFVTTSTVMARRDCILQAGLFPENRRIAEDYELWLRMAVRWKVGIIERALLRYRYRHGSLSYYKLNSTRCALDVVETFWRDHPQYQRTHRDVHRLSLARHLANASLAALYEGKRAAAATYALRSLAHDLGAGATWRCLAKTVFQRHPRIARAGDRNSSRTAEPA
jgi:glycosyltransferase involved in cell wall biosynthesis